MSTTLVLCKRGFIAVYKPWVCNRYIIAHRYILATGWLIVVIKQFYNYRLAISTKGEYDSYADYWCYVCHNCAKPEGYPTCENCRGLVMHAFTTWDPITQYEPPGWIRNPTTGRRRAYDEDGIIVKEWIDA